MSSLCKLKQKKASSSEQETARLGSRECCSSNEVQRRSIAVRYSSCATRRQRRGRTETSQFSAITITAANGARNDLLRTHLARLSESSVNSKMNIFRVVKLRCSRTI